MYQHEIENAKVCWIKALQCNHFAKEIKDLKECGNVNPRSRVAALGPTIDDTGLIRVGRRFTNSNDGANLPILLPHNEEFTKRLIQHIHQSLLHSGVGNVVIELRQQYWIIRARSTVKRILHECNICKRFHSRPFKECFAPLPEERIRSGDINPFTHIGIDFTGPLYVKNGRHINKIYILLITCSQTRAVHLELSKTLSLLDCLMAFQRFTSRRGVPTTVISDNGKTFVSLAKQFQTTGAVRWKFITPGAPWHGGFYERIIRIMKNSLRKTLKNAFVTQDELHTLICRIEEIINNRPLTFVSDSIDDPKPLTPSHFLNGRTSTELIETFENSSDITLANLTRRFKFRIRLLNNFWKIWPRDYLRSLIVHSDKPKRRGCNLKVGDVVLLNDEQKPRQMWPMGVVEETVMSQDGRMRSVIVGVNGKTYNRSIEKLYP